MSTPREIIERATAAGFSQTFIEQQTGVSQPTISRILSGDHADPKSSTLKKLETFAAQYLKPADQTPEIPV